MKIKGEKINVVLPKELKEKIELIAIKKNISRNSIVRLALSEFLERNK